MRRVVGILLLTLGLCGWPLIVQAATAGEGFSDNFNDNARNTTVWNINSLEGSAVDPLVTSWKRRDSSRSRPARVRPARIITATPPSTPMT